MEKLERIKILLGIDDGLQDDLLVEIIGLTESHFLLLTNQTEIPDVMSHIIVEVAIKRFNRLGAEGYGSRSVEGLSIQFGQSDFDEYLPLLKRQYPSAFGRSGVKFL